jgi:hypothetical protein
MTTENFDIAGIWEQALDSEKGIAIECESASNAMRLAFQLHTYRKNLSDQLKETPMLYESNRVGEMYNLTVQRSGPKITISKVPPPKVTSL